MSPALWLKAVSEANFTFVHPKGEYFVTRTVPTHFLHQMLSHTPSIIENFGMYAQYWERGCARGMRITDLIAEQLRFILNTQLPY